MPMLAAGNSSRPATQTGAQGANLARTAALTAGWPHAVAGQSVNRFCASGIDAVKNAAAMIASEQAELVVTGARVAP